MCKRSEFLVSASWSVPLICSSLLLDVLLQETKHRHLLTKMDWCTLRHLQRMPMEWTMPLFARLRGFGRSKRLADYQGKTQVLMMTQWTSEVRQYKHHMVARNVANNKEALCDCGSLSPYVWYSKPLYTQRERLIVPYNSIRWSCLWQQSYFWFC